jgi:hypothetical protein
MRAKFIYEKFTEDSDPVKDLGIGLMNKNFNSIEELNNWVIEYLPLILKTKEIPKTIISQNGKFIREKYYYKIEKFLRKYNITVNKRDALNNFFPSEVAKILKNRGFKASW